MPTKIPEPWLSFLRDVGRTLGQEILSRVVYDAPAQAASFSDTVLEHDAADDVGE